MKGIDDADCQRLDLDDLGGEVCLIDFAKPKKYVGEGLSPGPPTVSRYKNLDLMWQTLQNKSKRHNLSGRHERLKYGVLSETELTDLRHLFNEEAGLLGRDKL